MVEILLSKLSVSPWAIRPEMANIIVGVINSKLQGGALRPQQVVDEELGVKYVVKSGKAIISMHGILLNKSMGMQGASGIVTTHNVESSLQEAVEDRSVESVILDMDSPGGLVTGTAELAGLVSELKNIKPIYAYVSGMACSACYWVACKCTKIYGYTTSEVGSVGVYCMHIDQSRADEASGVKVTYIKAGDHKVVGNSHEPLVGESLAVLQKRVNHTYDLFTTDVDEARGIDSKATQALVYRGQEAIDMGLMDEIINFDGLVNPSNIYSFLRGGEMLGIKGLTAEKLKEERADLFEAIKAEGAAEEKAASELVVSQLEAELELLKAKACKDEKIRKHAATLGMPDEGERLIAEDASLETALDALISTSAKSVSDARDAFTATAPPPAGNSDPDLEAELGVPTTQMAAKEYAEKKYSVSGKQAWTHAKKDFPTLFGLKKGDE